MTSVTKKSSFKFYLILIKGLLATALDSTAQKSSERRVFLLFVKWG